MLLALFMSITRDPKTHWPIITSTGSEAFEQIRIYMYIKNMNNHKRAKHQRLLAAAVEKQQLKWFKSNTNTKMILYKCFINLKKIKKKCLDSRRIEFVRPSVSRSSFPSWCLCRVWCCCCVGHQTMMFVQMEEKQKKVSLTINLCVFGFVDKHCVPCAMQSKFVHC